MNVIYQYYLSFMAYIDGSAWNAEGGVPYIRYNTFVLRAMISAPTKI